MPTADAPAPVISKSATITRAAAGDQGTGAMARANTAAFDAPAKSARQAPASATTKSAAGRRVSA